MTRFLIHGDVHVGSGTDRIADQAAVLERVVELAKEQAVDAVLFTGDATHHRSVIEEVAVFQHYIRELDGAGIRFLGCVGNHDRSTMDVPSTLEVAARGFRNAKVANRPSIVGRVDGIHIAALPWCPTSAIAALHPDGNHDDVVRTAEEILVDIARGLRASVEGPAVLIGHWSLSGAITPTGADVSEFREVVLPTTELAEMGWLAVPFGHIHQPDVLNPTGDSLIFYTGSTACTDFGEADTPHGVWILDADHEGLQALNFVDVADRRFVTIGKDDVLTDGSLDGAIVRVRYEATADEERHIDHALIVQNVLAAGAHRVAGIQPTITRADGTRAEITEDVSVDEAFTTWLAGQDVDLAQIERVGVAHHEIREAVAR